MPDATPTERLVLQRIRNRMIETLEMLASFEEQRAYEKQVAIVNVPYELINSWEDCMDGPSPSHFIDPVFTNEERSAITAFHSEWDLAASALPDKNAPLSVVQAAPYWNRLRDASAKALVTFQKRGRLSEEVAIAE
jgi:hypothetical protein